MRKNLWCLLACLLLPEISFAGAYSISISTNVVCIVPARGTATAADYSTGTVYVTGSVVENASKTYLCLGGGTSGTNAPTHSEGPRSDGTLSWYRIQRRGRQSLTITLASTNGTVALGTSFNVSLLSGVPLFTKGAAWWLDIPYDEPIYAIASATNTVLAVEELP